MSSRGCAPVPKRGLKLSIINVQGHKEHLATQLREAAAKVEAGEFAFIALDDEGGSAPSEIQFTHDDAYGLADKPLAEVEDE